MSDTVDPNRWQRIRDVFDAAVSREGDDRAAYLDDACDGDDELRREVESLLAADAQAAPALGRAVAGAIREVRNADEARWVGRRIGPYEVESVIGRGGMGLVLRAHRADRHFDRRVAIKLASAVAHADHAARFRGERQILATLDHPHIARLLDGGETDDGVPYLVMEFVEGMPIDQYCADRRLSVRDRLDLFRKVCAAVHYAHRNLVVHRDLKPGNILVGDDGAPKLLDFGIAKLLEDDAAGERTATAMRALTPEYASPEQVRGDTITTASDVYSLGVLLYELLAGSRPYSIDTTQPRELERVVCDTDPVRPSEAAARPGGVERSDRLRRELEGDLDTIVLTAMRKEPERRYGSVDRLSEDILRYLRGRPIDARPDTARYRVSKFVRRNKALVAATAAVFAALVAGLAVSTWQHHKAELAREDEARQRRIAEAQTDEAQWQAYVAGIAAGESSILMNQIAEASYLLERAPERLRGWEWRHLENRLDRSLYARTVHGGGITRIAYAPDGAWLATSSMDNTVGKWSAATGDSLLRWGPFDDDVESVDVDARGRYVAAGFHDGSVRVWDAGDGAVAAELNGPSAWAMVAFRPDGERLAASFMKGEVVEWRAGSFERADSFGTGQAFVCIAYSSDGAWLITGGSGGHVKVWDAHTHRLHRDVAAHGRRVMNIVASPDGSRFVSASMDRSARVWMLPDGEPVVTQRAHTATVVGAAFSRAGTEIITSGADRQILQWDAATGAVSAEFRGGGEDAYSVAASPDGAEVVTGGWNGTLRRWRWDTDDVRTLRAPQLNYLHLPVTDACMSPDGTLLASAGNRDEVDVWDPRTGALVATLTPRSGSPVTRVAFGADGTRAIGVRLYAAQDSVVGVFDARALSFVDEVAAHRGVVTALDVSRDGRMFVTAGVDSLVRLWDARTLEPQRTFAGHAGAINEAVFSPDGALVASASDDGTVRLWNAADADGARVLTGHDGGVTDVAFGPDGTRLVSAGADGVRVWDLASGAFEIVPGGVTRIETVCFLHDGTRLALGGRDQIVRVIDAATLRETARLHGHVGRILSLDSSPHLDCIVSGAFDGTVRIWDAAP